MASGAAVCVGIHLRGQQQLNRCFQLQQPSAGCQLVCRHVRPLVHTGLYPIRYLTCMTASISCWTAAKGAPPPPTTSSTSCGSSQLHSVASYITTGRTAAYAGASGPPAAATSVLIQAWSQRRWVLMLGLPNTRAPEAHMRHTQCLPVHQGSMCWGNK
jgi:hypothetical protein